MNSNLSLAEQPTNIIPLKDNNGVWIWQKNYPKDIAWDISVDNGTVLDVFDRSVALYADKPALLFRDTEYSYAEFAEMVNRVAKGLQNLGVKKA